MKLFDAETGGTSGGRVVTVEQSHTGLVIGDGNGYTLHGYW